MHLFSSLGEIIEAPGAEQARMARMLGLPGEPNRHEFTNLFVIQLFPYASIYLNANGVAGGAVRRRAADYWRLTGGISPHEPDHVTALLKLYGSMQPTPADFTSPSIDTRRIVFWEMLASWLPMYLLRIRELGSPLYQAWSDVLFDVIEAEAGQLEAPAVMTSFLAAAPAAPSINEAGAFVDSLFAPAVSGIIICRADLGRCAAAHRLTIRLADRRHTLKLMLMEKTGSVCAWLCGEFTRQADNLRRLPDVLSIVRDHWVRRAETSAAAIAEFEARYARPGHTVNLI